MSFIACNRRGCSNIMCGRYSYEHGYICDECFEELTGLYDVIKISEFMESEKPNKSNFDRFRAEEYLEKIFQVI